MSYVLLISLPHTYTQSLRLYICFRSTILECRRIYHLSTRYKTHSRNEKKTCQNGVPSTLRVRYETQDDRSEGRCL